MKRLMFVAFAMIGLSAAGCGKSGSSDPVSQMKGHVDKICACKGDEKCLEKASEAFDKWEDEAHKGKKPDDATMAKLEAEKDRMLKCMMGE